MKIFFIKTILLYCHLCLSTGSKEIFIKREKKRRFFFFFFLQRVEVGGGVRAEGTCSLKVDFFIDAIREDTHKKKCFFSDRTTKVLPFLH